MLDWHMFGFKMHKFEYFYPLEVVIRGSETQLQVGKILKVVQFYLFNLAPNG